MWLSEQERAQARAINAAAHAVVCLFVFALRL